MENHFYYIKWSSLNASIFITHVRNLRNGCYANDSYDYPMSHLNDCLKMLT